jgi:small-conductance mechanosensitive channel
MDPETPQPTAPSPTGFALPDWVQALVADPVGFLRAKVLTPEFLVPLAVQGSIIFGVLLAGFILAGPLRRGLTRLSARLPANVAARAETLLRRLLRPALWAGLFWIVQGATGAPASADGQAMAHPYPLVRIATSLATAWLIIRTATLLLPQGLRKPVTWVAWIVAGLNAFGVLGSTLDAINAVGFNYGGRFINAGFILQAVLTAAIFLYGAQWLSKRLKQRVDTLPRVEPSLRILLGNAVQIGVFLAAALLTLAGLGIPLEGLAVLGGAIGVGVGFGLQQIVANFFSGVILLTDRSIKPDDVIEVDDTYGVVKSLGLRYASVVTRDGKEHLIPNEKLVTDKVVNWSYSSALVRIKKRLRVEYDADLPRAIALVEAACATVPRVLADPAPRCLVIEFGEDAIELEARFWIHDAQNGVNNVGSDVLMAIWQSFRDNGVEFPMRHQDINLVPGGEITVRNLPPSDPDADR